MAAGIKTEPTAETDRVTLGAEIEVGMGAEISAETFADGIEEEGTSAGIAGEETFLAAGIATEAAAAETAAPGPFADGIEEGTSAGRTAGEEARALAAGIAMEAGAETGAGPFADGIAEGNPTAAGATGVTLGATGCMFGTCPAAAAEIKENAAAETAGVRTCAVGIDRGTGASSSPLVAAGVDKGRAAAAGAVWYR